MKPNCREKLPLVSSGNCRYPQALTSGNEPERNPAHKPDEIPDRQPNEIPEEQPDEVPPINPRPPFEIPTPDTPEEVPPEQPNEIPVRD